MSFSTAGIKDDGERMLPVQNGEVSVVFSRHKFAYKYVSQFVANKSVIDIGCGAGYGCKILSETADTVLGIDYNKEAILYCKENFSAPNITFLNIDASKHFEPETKFDVAVTFQVIEHIHDINGFLEQIKRIVKPGGKIFITTPNSDINNGKESENPFHVNEMDYKRFKTVLQNHFSSFKISGVAFAKKSILRSVVEKLPFYNLGRKLKRNSGLKKIATRALNMTSYRIIESNIEKDAADLLAECDN
ncbi:MAG: class I SAM-dependent methyltransferase [Fibrobacter sp.]|nr:class I SAM-dependent methyltransferase [Fibrobacter sp.]